VTARQRTGEGIFVNYHGISRENAAGPVRWQRVFCRANPRTLRSLPIRWALLARCQRLRSTLLCSVCFHMDSIRANPRGVFTKNAGGGCCTPPPPPAPRAPMPSAAGRWLRARPHPVRGAERGLHFLGERRWPVLSCGARKRRGGRAGVAGGRSAQTLSR
jgi:hypothetical protein